jgi:hypothetical protein
MRDGKIEQYQAMATDRGDTRRGKRTEENIPHFT